MQNRGYTGDRHDARDRQIWRVAERHPKEVRQLRKAVRVDPGVPRGPCPGKTPGLPFREGSSPRGFGAPPVNSVLQFDGGGTLSILREYRNGQLVWDPAAVGIVSNNVDEVTCSFTLSNGDELEMTPSTLSSPLAHTPSSRAIDVWEALTASTDAR
jgi:hypothetical protein